MKTYRFYGHENVANIHPVNSDYPSIHNPIDLYDALSHVWSVDTCAPRYRPEWSKENMTLGQCSISSFLIQDIFGGEVRGVALPEGGYHCFNIVGGVAFDLTSEQFGNQKLDYSNCPIQTREEHFASKEKYERYLLLKSGLDKIK